MIELAKTFLNWQSEHKKNCCIVHFGSSGSMEREGAIQSFLQSIEKRNLKYTVFVRDGDTDCFGSVHDECKRIYGDSYIVTKEECIGHMQKRLGNALMKYKSVMRGTLMADKKIAGGKRRLTDKASDKCRTFLARLLEMQRVISRKS